MLPRDPRRQNSGRQVAGGSKVDRVPGRQHVPATRSGGNAPVMGTVIGFSPPATTSATNERLLFTFHVLIGYTVEVQVRSRSGIGTPSLCLRDASKTGAGRAQRDGFVGQSWQCVSRHFLHSPFRELRVACRIANGQVDPRG